MLEGCSASVNLNHNTKIAKLRIALKAFLYQFKRANKTFLLKNSVNCESRNLIHVVNYQR